MGRMTLLRRLVPLAFVLGPSLAITGPQEPATTTVDFARDVRPILSDNCYRCHGFDPQVRKAGLRLDQEEGAFAQLRSGGYAVRPGDAEGSELVQRILAADPQAMLPTSEREQRRHQSREETAHQADAFRTLGLAAVLVTDAKTDAALVSQVLEILPDGSEGLAQAYYRAGFISRDTVRLGIAVPLHPAAERFYGPKPEPEQRDDGDAESATGPGH